MNNLEFNNPRRDFFYYSLCHYCKKTLEKYQRCASCKSVSYCSENHQMLNWRDHKQLCKAITLTRKTVTYRLFKEWNDYHIHCQMSWKRFLKRDLLPFEYQIWMFPRICAVCHSEDDLEDCGKCRNVAYCGTKHSEQHKLLHSKFCDQLKLCMEIDQYLGKGLDYPAVQMDNLVKCLCKVQSMSELIAVYEINGLESVLLTDAISSCAVIYNALKYTNIEDTNRIIFHVVGSSTPEATLDWYCIAEVIFHVKPNVSEITFNLIGPEAWFLATEQNLCSLCLGSGKSVTINVFVNLYHKIIDTLEQPNLVIAFNCGLHENQEQYWDTWKESFPVLLRYKAIPFVFTSYTKEELQKDLACLSTAPNMNFDILFYGENEFASLRPLRDFSTTDIPVFYSNAYIGIVTQLSEET